MLETAVVISPWTDNLLHYFIYFFIVALKLENGKREIIMLSFIKHEFVQGIFWAWDLKFFSLSLSLKV